MTKPLTYSAIHSRLTRKRGPASQQICAGCGGQAQEWAYDHEDPDEVSGPVNGSSTIAVYSLDLTHYRPLCRSCHRTEDHKNRGKTHCKHGHEFTEANTYLWQGERCCRACNRRNVAASKARREEKR